MFLVLPVFAVANQLCEYYNTGDDNQNQLYYSSCRLAQTFTVGDSEHTLTSIRLKLWRQGDIGSPEFRITNTDAEGKPSSFLRSVQLSLDITTDQSGAWYTIPITEIKLSANVKYAIVIIDTACSGSNYLCWRVDASSPTYGGGSYAVSADGGSTWTLNTNYDCMFEVYGTILPISISTRVAAQVLAGTFGLVALMLAAAVFTHPDTKSLDATIELIAVLAILCLSATIFAGWGY
jgi:hypothetical protein